jgi:DNA-binding GntR family transcriptional regulator
MGVKAMPAEQLTSLDRSTLRERALDLVRTAIISGQYRPGDHLSEVELAAGMGVSRGTVREALRHLQQEGLAKANARGMLLVHNPSGAEIRELYEVRAALEGLAVTRLIASPIREEAVDALRKALSEMDRTDLDFAAHTDADLAFHLLMCRLSGNSVLVDAWRHLEGRVRVVIMNGKRPEIMSGRHHESIVNAIEGGDVGQALKVVQEHMTLAADRLAEPAEGPPPTQH